MRVLLYEQNAKMQKRSGIGRALKHQKRALELNGIETTFDPNDQYDFVHVSTCKHSEGSCGSCRTGKCDQMADFLAFKNSLFIIKHFIRDDFIID